MKMPIPTPKADEEKNKFLARCVHDHIMIEEYPNAMQRVAVCLAQWDKK
jgi:hypothetical protein